MTTPALTHVGLMAGRGRYPLLFCEAAKAHGVARLVVVAMHGETDPAIASLADEVVWVHVGQLNKAIQSFVQREVRHVVFAGQVKPARLFGDLRPDFRALKLLATLRLRHAESIFGAIADEFERDGVHVLPATTFLEESLATLGQLGKVKPKRRVQEDIDLGWRVAREVSRLDVGQTVVVKDGTVLAVEGFEGTDQAILRGGELGHGGVVVVKVAKPRHDMRFDVPCIGTRSAESLQRAGAVALAVQAGKTLLIDRAETLAALDRAKIAVVGVGADEA
jgi:DUF1009 family protein